MEYWQLDDSRRSPVDQASNRRSFDRFVLPQLWPSSRCCKTEWQRTQETIVTFHQTSKPKWLHHIWDLTWLWLWFLRKFSPVGKSFEHSRQECCSLDRFISREDLLWEGFENFYWPMRDHCRFDFLCKHFRCRNYYSCQRAWRQRQRRQGRGVRWVYGGFSSGE